MLTDRTQTAPEAETGAVACAQAGALGETDEALAMRAGAGDRGAFVALVGRYEHRVYRFAMVRLGSEHDACEVAQETLLRAWRSAPAYRASSAYASWVLSIAHHEIVNVVRRRKRDRRDRQARRIEPAHGPDELREGLPDIWRTARDVLEDAVFEIVWLRYAEGLEPRQIAVVTGRSAVGVRVLLHRARLKIAEALGEEVSERAP